jgi:hypothetical protein
MCDWFLEQWLNTVFCVKLERIANYTCELLSEAYGKEAMKKSCVFGWHKESCEKVEGDEVVQDLTQPLKMSKKCGIWFIQTDV